MVLLLHAGTGKTVFISLQKKQQMPLGYKLDRLFSMNGSKRIQHNVDFTVNGESSIG